MNNFTRTIILINVFLALLGCDYSLKNQIEEYKGDGAIKYLPALLGSSGTSITMPEFSLNANYKKTYNLSGIPQGRGYVIYLVVPNENASNKIKNNSFSYIVRTKDDVLLKKSSIINKLIKTSSGEGIIRKLYFFDPDDIDSTDFAVTFRGIALSIEIQYSNSVLNEPINGYLLISHGGFK